MPVPDLIGNGTGFRTRLCARKYDMHVVVTRPLPDGERTAEVLRARGHSVLVAPLMRIEPVTAHVAGGWGGVIITSANAVTAIAGNPARERLIKLPLYAVGTRSA